MEGKDEDSRGGKGEGKGDKKVLRNCTSDY